MMQNQGMDGKVCLVTGANNGMGFETAKKLTALGAHVVMVCRSRERGEAARQRIARETGHLPDLLLADLSLQREIKRVAAEYRAQYERLDVLVNVAGFAFNTREVTDEGFERTFALNYLGYFSLTLELVDLLVSSAPARVVNITSEAHRWSDIAFDNLQGEKSFPKRRMPPLPLMYGWTNMYRIMFTYELADRLAAKGVSANCLCPGFVAVSRSSHGRFTNGLTKVLGFLLRATTAAKAAETIVYLASSPEAAELTGAYYESGKLARSAPQSYDKAVRTRLWSETLRLTGYENGTQMTQIAQIDADFNDL
ncbi:MAG: SDR family NAD(P)-dependent oxidoreductase [Ardenticatenaceae bacterium]